MDAPDSLDARPMAVGVIRHVHRIMMAAAPTLKPRIWYGMPAYAASANTPPS